MELTIQTQTATADEVLRALVTHGVVIDFARANGQPIDVTPWRELALALSAEVPGTMSGAVVLEVDGATPNPLAGVDFASDDAAELAAEGGLTAADFEGRTPSGKTGHTVADVRAILAERSEE